MKTVRYFGYINHDNEWIKIDPEKAVFDLPDAKDPYEFFHQVIPTQYFLIYYKIIKKVSDTNE